MEKPMEYINREFFGEFTCKLVDESDPWSAAWLLSGRTGLRTEHAEYLRAFGEKYRIRRDAAEASLLPDPVRRAAGLPIGDEGAYFVGGRGYNGADPDPSIIDRELPPAGQPNTYCQWIPNDDGTAIVWDQLEYFHDCDKWLEYLIEHFLKRWGYVLNGTVSWQGEEEEDRGFLEVQDNRLWVYRCERMAA
jgi:hypothetical protein